MVGRERFGDLHERRLDLDADRVEAELGREAGHDADAAAPFEKPAPGRELRRVDPGERRYTCSKSLGTKAGIDAWNLASYCCSRSWASASSAATASGTGAGVGCNSISFSRMVALSFHPPEVRPSPGPSPG